MALTSIQIAEIKAYLGNDSPEADGVYSVNQLVKWTNPDVTYASSLTIDQDIYTNMIVDADVWYRFYYGANFATSDTEQMSVMSRAVLLVMANWRNPDKHKIVRDELRAMKRAKLRTQQVTPVTIDYTQDSRNIDSEDTQYQGPAYENKL